MAWKRQRNNKKLRFKNDVVNEEGLARTEQGRKIGRKRGQDL